MNIVVSFLKEAGRQRESFKRILKVYRSGAHCICMLKVLRAIFMVAFACTAPLLR